MAWVLTKQLQAFRDQMNAAFPDRDRTSDGTIGDAAHAASSSGHNPDLTANAEYEDGDAKDEVRAIDVDADTGDPDVSMEDIVQHLLKMARAGKLWMIRYMIFDRRIWSAVDGWAQREYGGPNPHTAHLHLSGAYTQSADEDVDADYHLEDLVALSSDDAIKVWNTDTAVPMPSWRSDKATNQTIMGASAMVIAMNEAHAANVAATALKAQLAALATAVAAIGATGTLTGEQLADLAAAVDQVDENVAERLVGETAEATAALLLPVLGDQAAEVGRILAAA